MTRFFILVLVFFAWLVGMGVYLLAQPYPEIRSVREGNGGAAISFAGMALGLALPLSVLPPVTESLMQIASVAILVLIIQLWVWVFVAYVLFPGLRKVVCPLKEPARLLRLPEWW